MSDTQTQYHPKYYFSVGAIFRNESHSIKEWIRHYIHHGADHFYLINDNSDDNFMECIQEFIEKNYVTLFNVNEPYYLGRQRNLYNRHILPLLNEKETKWLLMIDLDEYVWSPRCIDLKENLIHSEHLGQIQMRQTIFGSNGYINQPKYLVPFFIKRRLDNSQDVKYKYFVNSSFEFTSLNIHHADFEKSEYVTNANVFMVVNFDWFTLNHYCCQSIDFWQNVKCKRGDGDHYFVRTMEHFYHNDINEIEDLELYNQNKELYYIDSST